MHPLAGARTPVALVDTPSSPLALCTAGCSGARQLTPRPARDYWTAPSLDPGCAQGGAPPRRAQVDRTNSVWRCGRKPGFIWAPRTRQGAARDLREQEHHVFSRLFLVLTCGGARRRCREPCTETRFHPESDGCAIDRATEIIKCCPSGSSIRC